MSAIALKVQSIRRADEPMSWEEEGRGLSEIVRRGLEGRRAPLVGVAVRRTRVDLIDLGPVREAGVSLHRFLGGLCVQGEGHGLPPEAVGVLGLLPVDEGSAHVLVFVEWPDGRWWHWSARLEEDRRSVIEASVHVRSAVEGHALPEGLGGWWARGRALARARDGEAGTPDPTVH